MENGFYQQFGSRGGGHLQRGVNETAAPGCVWLTKPLLHMEEDGSANLEEGQNGEFDLVETERGREEPEHACSARSQSRDDARA